VDSSATALADACLLLTCLPQQHLAAIRAIKMQTLLCDFIVFIRPAQHTARGPHEARESFSCGPRELSQLQKMLRKLDLE